jgi:AraC family transcriptional regulator of adaptative response/methylated-DNA-[protein]-cysteine methyltransferase
VKAVAKRSAPNGAGIYGAAVSDRFERVRKACAAMEDAGGPVEASVLAAAIPCSVRQLQRDFRDVTGTTPQAYGKAVRTQQARRSLKRTSRVTDAMFDAGYGSVRAFYEEAGRRLGMTPVEYAAGGGGRVLIWGVTPSAIGQIVAVASVDGLCAVKIGDDVAVLTAEVLSEFPNATVLRDDAAMRDVFAALRAIALGVSDVQVPTHVRATAFQARVWAALRRIPHGQTRTYSEVAEDIGSPSSVRAVARACAMNPVALVVPCHRVIRQDGSLAGYRWGLEVKEALLHNEQS